MMTKLPIIGSTCSALDAAYALAHVPCRQVNSKFKAGLAVLLEAGTVHTLNSGIASFYIILEALKTMSPKKEVILPAYTAGSLVVALKKAGLKPVLCDISPDDFNADLIGLRKAISDDTLAVVAVHMFGIPIGYIDTLKANMPGSVFLIEDCCQSMASRIQDRPVGSFADISFFSFNRGKNLPANNGGCIIIRNGALEEPVRMALKNVLPSGYVEWTGSFLETVLFMLGTNPFVYGLGHALASGFRETEPPQDFIAQALANFQSSLGLRCLRKADALFMARFRNGMALLQGLAGVSGLRLPSIGPNLLSVFNRLPILFEQDLILQLAQNKLWQKGIESSRMYVRPLHHMFDLKYNRDDFPNARFLADHLLTLPVHPGVGGCHIKTMIDTIRGLI
jgi:dTDP-4-amino-4,6-dideoxygalactose transaminase